MFDLDKWNEIYQTLTSNVVRTILTAFGVFWGIFMLVLMMGAGNGLKNGITQEYEGQATNSFFIWTQSTTKPFKGLPAGRGFNMNNEDFIAIRQQISSAEIIAPRNQLGGHRGSNEVVRGKNTAAFGVMGDYPEIQHIEPIDVAKGRFINKLDIRDRRKIAIIGPRVEEVLFEKDEDPIGGNIRINGVIFKVVGVFKSSNDGDMGDRDAQRIYIPFTTFQQAFNYGDIIGWFAITSKASIPASIVEEEVLQFLKVRHRVHPDDRRAFGSWNSEKGFKQITALFTGIGLFTWIVGIGTLIAGVIGVSNIMLVVVKERTKEIGIRRALGATPVSITSQIIMESVILTSIAGYLGLVLGVGINEWVSYMMESGSLQLDMVRRPGVALSIALKALAILVFSGVLAGLLPAIRAVSLKPVDALRAD